MWFWSRPIGRAKPGAIIAGILSPSTHRGGNRGCPAFATVKTKNEVVAYFEALARTLPVRYRARVAAIKRDSNSGNYVVEVDGGEKLKACNVVVATGLYQAPKIPALSRAFPPGIKQLHSDSYRNPEQLLPGAVRVTGEGVRPAGRCAGER